MLDEATLNYICAVQLLKCVKYNVSEGEVEGEGACLRLALLLGGGGGARVHGRGARGLRRVAVVAQPHHPPAPLPITNIHTTSSLLNASVLPKQQYQARHSVLTLA